MWRLRAAAIVALLAPPTMVAVTIAALVGDIVVAALAFVAVLAASAATWFALTRRGRSRAFGVVLAACAVVALLVLLIVSWHGVLLILVLLLLLAIFGVSARYALSGTDKVSVSVLVPRVEGAAVLIINPKSGAGKAEHFALAAEARRRDVEPIVLAPGDDLSELAERAVADGARVIGMAGGDGSQALIATVAARNDVAYVCVPAGTRNHLALDLGLDRDDVVGALDAFTEAVERRIDLANVNGRVFVNNASLGLYAKVVQSEAYRDAKLETWTTMLPELMGPDADPIDLEFARPDGTLCDEAALVLVSNNPYQLTHMGGMGTREQIDSGTLGVTAVRIRGAADASGFVAMELVGQIGRFPGLMSWSTPTFEVHSSSLVEVGLDGEALVLEPPLRFSTLPRALRVWLPRSAGLAPAARGVALTTTNLGVLLRVAAGR
jgi:diacylglycerol kinase family enzyme